MFIKLFDNFSPFEELCSIYLDRTVSTIWSHFLVLQSYGHSFDKSMRNLEILHSPSMFAVKAKFMECYIIKQAQSFSMKHLVIGQR